MKKIIFWSLFLTAINVNSQSVEFEEVLKKYRYKIDSLVLNENYNLRYSSTGETDSLIVIFLRGSNPGAFFKMAETGLYPPLPFSPYKYKNVKFVIPERLDKPFFEGELPRVNFDNKKTESLKLHLETYSKLIKKIKKEKKNLKIILVCHSEGSRIGYELSKNNKNIDYSVLMSFNPFGRYYEEIKRIDTINNFVKDSIQSLYLLKENSSDFYSQFPILDNKFCFKAKKILFVCGNEESIIESNVYFNYILKSKFSVESKLLVVPGNHNYFYKNVKGELLFGWDNVIDEVFSTLAF